MKFRTMAFGLVTAALAAMTLFNSSPALAQVGCNDISINPGYSWPPASATRACSDVFPTQYGGLMRDTLEQIGISQSDAASRLSEQVPYGESIHLQITDPAINGGSMVQEIYTTSPTDSSVTVAAALADLVNGDGDLGGHVLSFASGTSLFLFSDTGNTSYGHVDATHVTISLNNLGTGYDQATIAGSALTDITWRIFESRSDYQNSPEPVNKLGPTDDIDAQGTSYIREGSSTPSENEKASSVFEIDGMSRNVDIVKNVTAHETGHQLDYIYGKLFNSGTQFSASSAFLAALDRDKLGMNGTPACAWDAYDVYGIYFSSGTTTANPGSGHLFTGMFSALKDGDPNHTGANYVCDGSNGDGQSSNYSGDNLAIIAAAYPAWKVQSGSATAAEAQEIFAELAAGALGFPDLTNNAGDPIDGSHNLSGSGNAFVCTNQYVNTLLFKGRVPTSTELAAYFYIVPDGTSSPYGDGFTIYRCDGSAGEHVDWENFGA